MPPIQRRVLRLGEGARGLVGSKAERLGGMVWRVPGVERAGEGFEGFMLAVVLNSVCLSVCCARSESSEIEYGFGRRERTSKVQCLF